MIIGERQMVALFWSEWEMLKMILEYYVNPPEEITACEISKQQAQLLLNYIERQRT